jgi:hypothetical protein
VPKFSFGTSKVSFAAAQSVLNGLLVRDIETDRVPFDDVSPLVPQWDASNRMPSIFSIVTAQTPFKQVRCSACSARRNEEAPASKPEGHADGDTLRTGSRRGCMLLS